MVDSLQSMQNIFHVYEFHHLGYATNSVNKEKEYFFPLGYTQEDEGFIDHVQGIAGCFLIGPGPRIELLENLPGSNTLTPWLNANVKLYHTAYFVDNFESLMISLKMSKARIVVEPVSAVAFNGLRICFAMFRNGMMVEFIEKPKS